MHLVQSYLALFNLDFIWFSPVYSSPVKPKFVFGSILSNPVYSSPGLLSLSYFSLLSLGFASSDTSGLFNPCLYLITSSKSFSLVSAIDPANLFQLSLFFILIILFVKHFFSSFYSY
jgi:hypothetical protein